MRRRVDRGDSDELTEAHEINVTPFIDVMLVLLIIFMVAAPLSTVDLPIDLPTSTAAPQKKPEKPTYVSIKPDLALALGETPVTRVDLVRALDAMPDHYWPQRSDIQTLGRGEFLVCWDRWMVRTYIQPAWMNSLHAQAIARRDVEIESAEGIKREFERQVRV